MHQPNDVQFTTTRLSTGLQVHYAEQGNPTGEAIVFLHAYVDSWFSYSRVLPLLSAGYHAFAPDQRGHGDSDKPQCCYTADDYAADVDAFMDAVRVEKATLVGDSSGGLIAQRVALDYPHRVSRLVLIGSPTTLLNNEAVMELGKEILALEDPVSPEFVREFVSGTVHHPVSQKFLVRAVSKSLKVPARVWRDYYEGVVLTVDDTARLGEIDAPTLILWGEQDALLPREEQEWRAAAIPNATLKVYPGTGHLAHWVRPEWVVRDLEEFMRGGHPA
ncbi:MAG TPA: alpha/beta hydrolase [Rubrobacteraceae bacterium]|nr:alpha/beta hydrolase [Rubrobacteraceae bacterium]